LSGSDRFLHFFCESGEIHGTYSLGRYILAFGYQLI
jgi:hypothetical protein